MRIDTTFINEQNYNWEDKAVLANTFKVIDYKRAAWCKCWICDWTWKVEWKKCEHCKWTWAIWTINLDRRNYMTAEIEYEKKKRHELFIKYSEWFNYYDENA